MAGYWREIHEAGGELRLQKVKAHQKEEAEMTDLERRHVRGNGHADTWAKAGAVANNVVAQDGEEGQRAIPEEDEEAVAQARAVWLRVARVMTRTLALWPPSKELWGVLEREVRPPTRQQARRADAASVHRWSWDGKWWRCTQCHLASRLRVRGKPCVQVAGSLRRLMLDHVGPSQPGGAQHQLWVVRRPHPKCGSCFVFCRICGAYAGDKAVRLAAPCQGRGASTRVALGYFRRGKDPRTSRPLGSRAWPLHEGVPSWWAAATAEDERRAEAARAAREAEEEPHFELAEPHELEERGGSSTEGPELLGGHGLDDSSASEAWHSGGRSDDGDDSGGGGR